MLQSNSLEGAESTLYFSKSMGFALSGTSCCSLIPLCHHLVWTLLQEGRVAHLVPHFSVLSTSEILSGCLKTGHCDLEVASIAWIKASLYEIAAHGYLEVPSASPGQQLTCTEFCGGGKLQSSETGTKLEALFTNLSIWKVVYLFTTWSWLIPSGLYENIAS